MEKADKLFGIYSDNQFMDHLYWCSKMNNDVKSVILPNNEPDLNIEKCGMHRVESVNTCLSKIESTEHGSKEWETYFNYIRWNQDNIANELESYLQQPCMEKHRGTISACRQYMNYVMDEFCKLTAADEAIISEYKHAYGIISHPQQQSRKVLLQTGKLFVNFVDILTQRYFYIETADIKFADLGKEAGVIFDKLSADFPNQSETVKMSHENFVQLITMQDVYRAIQNDLLQKALKSAHARATETILQTTKQLILRSISLVTEKQRAALNNTITISEAIFHPVMHPIETAKSIGYTIQHPQQSTNALLTWARENPSKCLLIVLGGTCLGAVVLCGGALLLIANIANIMLVPLVAGGVIGGVMAPLAVTARRPQTLVKSAKGQVSYLKCNSKPLENDLKTECEKIAVQTLDRDLCFFLDEKNVCATPDQEIETMSYDELLRKEKELKEQLPVIEDEIRGAQRVVAETMRDMLPDQEEASVIQRASDIFKRRIANLTITISERN